MYQDDDNTTLYDVVTEEQYKAVVGNRLARDDFVVDDGVDGYMDNGMDDFEERYDSEEDVKQTKCMFLATLCLGPAVTQENYSAKD